MVKKKEYTIRKLRFAWAVVHVETGAIKLSGIPTRLRAYYAASRLNGNVGSVFNFGDML